MAKHKQNLRISIVIPVYNEAASIADCLDAIAMQTVKPFEVIVVDNNSTDETVAIAESYWFVKVISESHQGVVYARDTGFSYAHGDVIGRIDADTIISETWVETLQQIFSCSSVAAVSGAAQYHDVALAKVCNAVDLVLRRYLAKKLGKYVGLQGANMALRRAVWKDIKKEVCNSKGMHEDLDLGSHASDLGLRNIFDERLVASIGFRQANSPFATFSHYLMLNPRTYEAHGLYVRRYVYPVIMLAIMMYWPIKIAHRGYDPVLGRFSLEKLLEVPDAHTRVNPATFVE
jgi:glycosyltransferase involved in cell wall biosynthesis